MAPHDGSCGVGGQSGLMLSHSDYSICTEIVSGHSEMFSSECNRDGSREGKLPYNFFQD